MSQGQPIQSELTVLDHIRSLRRTVFSIVLIILLASSVVHYFKDAVLSFLLAPLGSSAPELQFLSPLDPLYFILKVDFILGFLLSLPITIFLIWRFVSPVDERRSALAPLIIIGASCALGLVAATYAYKLLIPIILNYMSGLVVPGTALSFTANGYLDFFLSTTTLLILVFQIPLLIVGLTYAGVLVPSTISKNRPHIFLAIIVITAFITPTTDLVSLALIAVPALVVVEFGTLMARFVYIRKFGSTGSASVKPALLSILIVAACIMCLTWLFISGSAITLFSSTTPNTHLHDR